MSETAVVLPESRFQVHFLWGFLTIVAAVVLVRAHAGMSGTGRIVADLIVGAFLLVCAWAWVWFARHPAHLEVTPDAIAFRHRGRRNAVALPHTGRLYVKRVQIGARNPPQAFLRVEGSEEAIALTTFSLARIRTAVQAAGWRFVDDA